MARFEGESRKLDQFIEAITREAGLIEWVRQGWSGLRELDRDSRRKSGRPVVFVPGAGSLNGIERQFHPGCG
jgi:hypothetical protein